MKKILIIILLMIPTFGFSQVKNAGCYLRMEKPVKSDTLSVEDENIKISFVFNSYNYFCKISIQNKTDAPISIDWDKFIMVLEGESHQILFDNTQMINKDSPKGESVIAPQSQLSRNIAPVSYIELNLSLYRKGWVKKYGTQEIGFVIPMIINDSLKYYNCTISVSLQ